MRSAPWWRGWSPKKIPSPPVRYSISAAAVPRTKQTYGSSLATPEYGRNRGERWIRRTSTLSRWTPSPLFSGHRTFLLVGHPQQPERCPHPAVHEIIFPHPLPGRLGTVRFLYGLLRSGHASRAAHAQTGIQSRIRHRPVPVRPGHIPVLARRRCRALCLFSARTFRHRQRIGFFGNGLKSFHRPVGRSGKLGTTSQLLAGLQSSRVDHWCPHRHHIHLLRRRTEFAASGFAEIRAPLRRLFAHGNLARGQALSRIGSV